MDSDIDTLKRSRRSVRTQLTKKIGELDAELCRSSSDRTIVQVRLDMIHKLYEKLDTLDQEILSIMSKECSEVEQEAELNAILDYEEHYRIAKLKGEQFLEEKVSSTRSSSPVSDSASTVVDGVRKKTYKLPKIEIRKFNGDLREWLGFWSQFQKIHEDSALHDSDKFQYLVQSMVPGTRALQLVSSYPQSAANYPLVINALQDRFGDKVLLTEVYVRQLLKLVIRIVGKQKDVTLSAMYDELESHLRALETLGVTQEQSAAFLYPLVESSLPEDIVRVWQRSAMSGYNDDDRPDKPVDERLKSLMKFIRVEVKGAERLSYVNEGFGETSKEKFVKDKKSSASHQSLPTAAGLFVGQRATCIFCDKTHDSQTCVNAQVMPYSEKRRKILGKKACLSCLKPGHMSKACKTYVKCIMCQKRHVTLMCPDLDINRKSVDDAKLHGNDIEQTPVTHSQLNCTNDVLLQTIRCVVRNGNKQKEVRVLLDSGSQKSYILEKTAHQLGASSKGEEKLCHLLFGGLKEVQRHNVYELEIEGTNNKVCTDLKVLGHERICCGIPKMSKGPWMSELKEKRIFVNDLGEETTEIELLIGADYYAKWLTGRKQFLKNGLVALETCFGWTLSGRLQSASDEVCNNVAMQVTSMFIAEASVSELWNLEIIGISDPIEQKTKKQREADVKEHFSQTVTRSGEGRYNVSLPWIEEKPEIPDNRGVAEKRLVSMTAKLRAQGQLENYQQVFDEWLAEGIIEIVNDNEKRTQCHYLPHRAVFKPESQTTPVRPVFDASCKVGRSPSLNELLEKGPNLLELLPTILLKFRENRIGVIADIRKAFQMIEVNKEDRDFLRFLWWEDIDSKKLRVYRHTRVVFGVNSSPFLLSAVIELHLNSVSGERAALAEKLLKSLYVDNCVTSVATYGEYELFKGQATEIMSQAKMNLRNWECTQQIEPEDEVRNLVDRNQNEDEFHETTKDIKKTKVLGLIWNKSEDTLSCEVPEENKNEVATKRVILSYLSRVFDPIGFLSPALLPVKRLLQNAWLVKSDWEEKLPEEISEKFRKWLTELQCLQSIKVARNITGGHSWNDLSNEQCQLHIFCDASQDAYAAVGFLRTEDKLGEVSVQLMMAKTRLAPLKRPTIPRLELLACAVGARMSNFLKEALNLHSIKSYMWSDSTTALAWIKRNDEWGTFVGNQVREICTLSSPEEWRHVPGANIPADLPSRGCSAACLLESKWWEGPPWLHRRVEDWPVAELIIDEEAVCTERKCTSQKGAKLSPVNTNFFLSEHTDEGLAPVTVMSNQVVKAYSETPIWYLTSSSYLKSVRVIAWIRRFVFNSKIKDSKMMGSLTVQEFTDAESAIMRLVQQEEFPKQAENIRGLVVARASDELYHVKTKLTHSLGGFSFPVLLPPRHPFVEMLIKWFHTKHHHAGAQYLMSKLRERFWILQARRTINKVIHKCPTCLRFTGKHFQVDPATLPICRTETSNAFQTTGVDLAGPLYLKNGEKAWIVLFTCAVYRGKHLDFVTSLSTESFLDSLERFINVRGRPDTIYSDNGSNFVGLVNLFKQLNWQTIEEAASVKQIKWIFNPPAAAWWGGWWERLIRTVKDLLKRMLGNARLNYDQLRTSLSQVENIINERPLTVVSEDHRDLIPLTPAMFLRGIKSASFPESTLLGNAFHQHHQKRQSLLQELKLRFCNEYLAQLVQRAQEKSRKRPEVGDVVLVGADNQKRLQWPMARIVELIPGRDGAVRTAKVKTQHGVILRPLQRLYPLEVSSSEDVQVIMDKLTKLPVSDETCDEPVAERFEAGLTTRSGRKINKPKKLSE